MNLEKEIIEFKKDVLNTGMYMNTYLNKRKEFIQKIDYASDNSMKFFMYLLYLNLITVEQYIGVKIRIDNSRKYYKSMLSFY